jgi:hypothetical protein
VITNEPLLLLSIAAARPPLVVAALIGAAREGFDFRLFGFILSSTGGWHARSVGGIAIQMYQALPKPTTTPCIANMIIACGTTKQLHTCSVTHISMQDSIFDRYLNQCFT